MAEAGAGAVSVVVGYGQMDAFLTKYDANVHREVMVAARTIGPELQTYIKTVKLNRPGGGAESVLHQRSGTLARSVHQEPRELPEGVVVRVATGAEAWYGALHEYGATILAHMRSDPRVPHPVFVKAYELPARPFMRPALEAFKPTWLFEVQLAMRRANPAAA